MAWTDFLFGTGPLKKAAKTGDAPSNTPPAAEPVPNYVQDQIKAQQGKPAQDGDGDTPVPPATPGPKKQPRVGFPPAKN